MQPNKKLLSKRDLINSSSNFKLPPGLTIINGSRPLVIPEGDPQRHEGSHGSRPLVIPEGDPQRHKGSHGSRPLVIPEGDPQRHEGSHGSRPLVIPKGDPQRHEGSHDGTAHMTSQVAFGHDKSGENMTSQVAFGHDKSGEHRHIERELNPGLPNFQSLVNLPSFKSNYELWHP